MDWQLYCLGLAELVGGTLFVSALAQLIELKIQKKGEQGEIKEAI